VQGTTSCGLTLSKGRYNNSHSGCFGVPGTTSRGLTWSKRPLNESDVFYSFARCVLVMRLLQHSACFGWCVVIYASNNSLFAVPANQEFVYIRPQSQDSDGDLVKYYLDQLHSSCHSTQSGWFWLSDHLSANITLLLWIIKLFVINHDIGFSQLVVLYFIQKIICV